METKYGFTKMDSKEFASYIDKLKVARTVIVIQQHHTYIPSYIHFKGNNHFELQRGMKNTHVNLNGWADIGQHISIFPDGSVVTGRSFEKSPACIHGNNANAFCIESIGNFDKGGNVMTKEQKDAIIAVTANLCKKFNLIPDTNRIVYHHWFNLATGVRNNGSGNNKSCPGTNFFEGNKVEDCRKYFIPLVSSHLKKLVTTNDGNKILKYVSVNSDTLNVRSGPSSSSSIVKDRDAALFGAILRIYEEKNKWYRISSSSQHWVSSFYTKEVQRSLVNADVLNVRLGPGTSFPKISSIKRGIEVFIYKQENGWSKISIDEKWVKDSYLSS
ncbi:SH3 domain-containing protein [Chryseobacterium sp. FH1]|uniref:SH3 domain-containing protein n=1 Tax=Chryseobacterium sp. FH1 TaxID=1233951 RepID=UPI0004E2A967|nr:SH3 domain-containing protein [Chryseobacterium sp. FH1]KFC19678.1 N-acetylmuramoyl-L-alanine amidase [Chryseobacterium sp. FH1]